MRLPIDLSQWGMLVIKTLVQQVPAAEPYVQFARIIENDPEGNAYGIVALTNGFVPFIVRGFELKPIDSLITIENGEQKFQNLSEANLILAVGGLKMGDPVEQDPVGVDQDQEINMMPPYSGMFGMSRRPRPDVLRQRRPVKFASADPALTEGFLKEASTKDPELAKYLAAHYVEGLSEMMAAKKQAADEASKAQVVIFDPGSSGVDVIKNGEKAASLTYQEAANSLRKQEDSTTKIASLMKGELVVFDGRPAEKAATFAPHVERREGRDENPHDIKNPGWYKIGGAKTRVFRTTQLDGSPCTKLLAINPTGHLFERTLFGNAADPATNEEMKSYYRPSHLKRGDLCFILNEKTDEASVPFTVEASTHLPGGAVKLVVRSKMGNGVTETIHFGDNKHPYRLGTDEVALPKSGYSVFVINPVEAREFARDKVQVRIYKGGGVYSIKEDKHSPFTGLTRGQLAHILMDRYGMTADLALDYVKQVNTYTCPDLYLEVKSDKPTKMAASKLAPDLKKEASGFAIDLWSFIKKAEDDDKKTDKKQQPAEKNGPNRDEEPPEPSGDNSTVDGGGGGKKQQAEEQSPGGNQGGGQPGTPPGGGQPAGQQDPNAPVGAEQGGAPQMMGGMVDMGAGIMPDIPGLKDVADTVTGYAMGAFTPDELSEIYSQLIDRLDDVQDLVGRILTLVRLGKVDFITENEAKRLLDESDKFRGALLNADMLLKGTVATV